MNRFRMLSFDGILTAIKANTMSAPDSRPIKEEVKKAVDDAKDHARNISEEVKDQASEAADALRDRAQQAKERAGDAIERARGKVRETGCELRAKGCDTIDHVREFIREKPVPAIIGFTALGVAIGYLLRSRCHRQSVLEEEAASLCAPLGRRLRSGYNELRSRGQDVFDTVHDHLPNHPLDAVVNRARSLAKSLKRH
jgi:ElaB/YqjD/DUF883 family membrane-anchored ribosome-binding protein